MGKDRKMMKTKITAILLIIVVGTGCLSGQAMALDWNVLKKELESVGSKLSKSLGLSNSSKTERRQKAQATLEAKNEKINKKKEKANSKFKEVVTRRIDNRITLQSSGKAKLGWGLIEGVPKGFLELGIGAYWVWEQVKPVNLYAGTINTYYKAKDAAKATIKNIKDNRDNLISLSMNIENNLLNHVKVANKLSHPLQTALLHPAETAEKGMVLGIGLGVTGNEFYRWGKNNPRKAGNTLGEIFGPGVFLGAVAGAAAKGLSVVSKASKASKVSTVLMIPKGFPFLSRPVPTTGLPATKSWTAGFNIPQLPLSLSTYYAKVKPLDNGKWPVSEANKKKAGFLSLRFGRGNIIDERKAGYVVNEPNPWTRSSGRRYFAAMEKGSKGSVRISYTDGPSLTEGLEGKITAIGEFDVTDGFLNWWTFNNWDGDLIVAQRKISEKFRKHFLNCTCFRIDNFINPIIDRDSIKERKWYNVLKEITIDNDDRMLDNNGNPLSKGPHSLLKIGNTWKSVEGSAEDIKELHPALDPLWKVIIGDNGVIKTITKSSDSAIKLPDSFPKRIRKEYEDHKYHFRF